MVGNAAVAWVRSGSTYDGNVALHASERAYNLLSGAGVNEGCQKTAYIKDDFRANLAMGRQVAGRAFHAKIQSMSTDTAIQTDGLSKHYCSVAAVDGVSLMAQELGKRV